MADLVHMITTLEKPPGFDEDLGEVSGEAKDLIGMLLRKKPEERPTAKEVLKHPWLSRQANELLAPPENSLILLGASDNLGKRRISKIEGCLNLGEKMTVMELIKELLQQGLDK